MAKEKDKAVKFTDIGLFPKPFVMDKPEYSEIYNFAWETAVKKIRETKGIRHMDTAWDPSRNFQWVWDLTFIGMYSRYAAEYVPAFGAYDMFYKFQRDDGYIGMTYDFTTGAEPWPDRINPPLFAWGELECYRSTGDKTRLAHAVSHIEKLMQWIDVNRRAPFRRNRMFLETKIVDKKDPHEVQLYYFEDCGSSGMDDSPRTPRRHEAGKHFAWIDLCSQMVLSFRCLAEIHKALGNSGKVKYWNSRADSLSEIINREMWCERTQFYHDKSFPINFVGHKTAASFWTILAGVCHKQHLDALITHLMDKNEFNRLIPVPTLSADDCNYSPEGVYWLGGVWAPTNYMITRGLMLAERRDIAHEIATKYLDALCRVYKHVVPHTLWECYAPEYDLPGLAAYSHKRVKGDFVGWTGVGPIAMLIENVIGIDANVPAGQIIWDIRLLSEHGVKNLAFGKGQRVDLLCHKRLSGFDIAKVEITSTVPFNLILRCAGRVRRYKVKADTRNYFAV